MTHRQGIASTGKAGDFRRRGGAESRFGSNRIDRIGHSEDEHRTLRVAFRVVSRPSGAVSLKPARPLSPLLLQPLDTSNRGAAATASAVRPISPPTWAFPGRNRAGTDRRPAA